MKFDNIYEFLSGKKFSNGLDVKFGRKHPLKTRAEKIIELIRGKNVIHIGFADHIPLIEEKINSKKWLHNLIIENANKCIGVDINQEAVEYIQKKFNIPDIYSLNVEEEDVSHILGTTEWDFVVLGEVIEHVNNPVNFLKNIHEKFNSSAKNIIITAPNVFNILTSKDIYQNKENINTDHRYWFSPYTLMKIIYESGFRNDELFFVEQVNLPLLLKIYKKIHFLLKKNVYLRAVYYSTILTVSKF